MHTTQLTPQMKTLFLKRIKEVHGDYDIPEELLCSYLSIAAMPELDGNALALTVESFKEQYFPELSFNQIRKRIFTALGYRSNGLADDIRVRYTTENAYEVITYPNLWHQVLNYRYPDTVFSSNYTDGRNYMPAYLELLFEAHIDEPDALLAIIDEPDFIEAFVHYREIAQEKTLSMRHIRSWVEEFKAVLGCSHNSALSLTAMAAGYKAWFQLVADEVHGTVTSKRHPWKFADSTKPAVCG